MPIAHVIVREPTTAPVTLPTVRLADPDIDIEAEAREVAALRRLVLKEIGQFCHCDLKSVFFGEHPAGLSFFWFVGKVAVGMRSCKPTNRIACANRDASKTRACCGNSHIAMKLS